MVIKLFLVCFLVGFIWCAAIENAPLVEVVETDHQNIATSDLETDGGELDTAESAQYGWGYGVRGCCGGYRGGWGGGYHGGYFGGYRGGYYGGRRGWGGYRRGWYG